MERFVNFNVNSNPIGGSVHVTLGLFQRGFRRVKLAASDIKFLMRNCLASRFPRPKQSLLRSLGSTESILFPSKKYVGTLKVVIRGCGFKDKVFTFLAPAIAYCLENDLYFSWDGDLGDYGNWNQFFLPFWEPQDCQSPITDFCPNWSDPSTVFRHIASGFSPLIVSKIWRYRPETQRILDEAHRGMTGNKSYWGIQIRRGDKLRYGGIQAVSAEKILSLLPEGMPLAVATDDFSVIEELLAVRPKLEIITTCGTEHRGSEGERNHFQSEKNVSKETETLRLLLDLELCIRADHFLRVKPKYALNRDGFSRNYQISDMISVLRNSRSETVIV